MRQFGIALLFLGILISPYAARAANPKKNLPMTGPPPEPLSSEEIAAVDSWLHDPSKGIANNNRLVVPGSWSTTLRRNVVKVGMNQGITNAEDAMAALEQRVDFDRIPDVRKRVFEFFQKMFTAEQRLIPVDPILNNSSLIQSNGDSKLSVFIEGSRSFKSPIVKETAQANYVADLLKWNESLSPGNMASVIGDLEEFHASAFPNYTKGLEIAAEDKQRQKYLKAVTKLFAYFYKQSPEYIAAVRTLLDKRCATFLRWGGKVSFIAGLLVMSWELGGDVVEASEGDVRPLVSDSADAAIPGGSFLLKKAWREFRAWCEEVGQHLRLGEYGNLEIEGYTYDSRDCERVNDPSAWRGR